MKRVSFFVLYFYNRLSARCLSVLKEKFVQAIKRIKHEVDECREAESETYVESGDLEVFLRNHLHLVL